MIRPVIACDKICYCTLSERGNMAKSENLPAVTSSGLTVPAARGVLARDVGAQVAATLQAAARSQHSQRAYSTAIGLFMEYLGQALGGPPLASVSLEGRARPWAFMGQANILRLVEPGHLAGYRAWRDSAGDSPNTASQRYAAVKTFLAVCYRDGILTDRQASRLGIRPYVQRQKRDRQPTGRRLTKQEARDLLAACSDTTKGKRDRAIMAAALYAGLRVDELASLDLENIVQDNGRFWLQFSGKGEKTRKVKVHDMLFQALTDWLAASGRTMGQGAGPLYWPVNKGDNTAPGRLAPSAINRLVAEYGAAAGLAELHGQNRLGPHDLRRTFARNAYDNGAPLPAIQAALGHADLQTTMRYIGLADPDGGAAVDFVNYEAGAGK